MQHGYGPTLGKSTRASFVSGVSGNGNSRGNGRERREQQDQSWLGYCRGCIGYLGLNFILGSYVGNSPFWGAMESSYVPAPAPSHIDLEIGEDGKCLFLGFLR